VAAIVAAAGSDFVERAARSDQAAWEREFGVAKDVSALGVERDVFRYLSLPVTVRQNAGGSPDELVRVVVAGVRAGGLLPDGSAAARNETGRHLAVSAAEPLSADLRRAIEATGASVVVETDDEWLARAGAGKLVTSRVRLVGGGHTELAEALGGSPDVAIYSDAVTEAGRIELLPFLREQAIAITAHRFGNPDHWSEDVLPL
jgi:RHH-type proline utilization regulon transcriptional repressor/proline dehydrogenase/delta 1-pyrroline-5-carboxylate dehydrogenase